MIWICLCNTRIGCAKNAWIYIVNKPEKQATTAGNEQNMKVDWWLLSQAKCKYATVLHITVLCMPLYFVYIRRQGQVWGIDQSTDALSVPFFISYNNWMLWSIGSYISCNF